MSVGVFLQGLCHLSSGGSGKGSRCGVSEGVTVGRGSGREGVTVGGGSGNGSQVVGGQGRGHS